MLEKVKRRCRAGQQSTRIGVHGMYGLRHRRETFGMRNTIKQWSSRLKKRIKQFNIQDKNNREMDKGMDSLKSTVSRSCFCLVCWEVYVELSYPPMLG